MTTVPPSDGPTADGSSAAGSPADVPVTPAATFCATLVATWRALGLRHAVVCPGSRSTPLALALVDAEADGVTVLVCLDERSAGFLALGLARATGRPVPVLTTSGTATANLHPAVVEAHHDLVPLIACTADRPPELHGVGAPQTIDQRHLFGAAVRAEVDAGVPDDTDPGSWRGLAAAVWAAAAGLPAGPVAHAPGPVQLDLPFREPLVGRPGALPAAPAGATGAPDPGDPGSGVDALDDLVAPCSGARVVVVAGPPTGPGDEDLLALADRSGWPVLADPRVPGSPVVARGDALLRCPEFLDGAVPDVVLRVGAQPASKVLGAWLDGLPAHQVGIDRWGRRLDPGGSLAEVRTASARDLARALASVAPAPDGWRDRWAAAEAAAEAVLAAELDGEGELTSPAVARIVSAHAERVEAALVVSSSLPVREVEWFGRRGGTRHANRGANGIDGVVSTCVGVALGSGSRTVGLLGDLAFLHDTNGLLALAGGPDCTLVVVDNGGGGIFHLLPQRSMLPAARFERLFGTPQGVDPVAVADAHGVPAVRVTSRPALRAALAERGPRVVVVPAGRDATVAEHQRLHGRMAEAVARAMAGLG